MKKLFYTLYFFLFSGLLQAQNPMQPILKTYFRTHPFDMRFSSFINSLQNDPWFTLETFNRRTDTSFFYLTGTYKNYNPYHYPIKEVRLVLAEETFVHDDSLHSLDTIINIQMLGITDSTVTTLSNVSKEYTRFIRNHAANFWRSTYSYAKHGNKTTAEVTNLFIYPLTISPISAGWGQMPDTKQYTFTITIRCKVKENTADLILAPGE